MASVNSVTRDDRQTANSVRRAGAVTLACFATQEIDCKFGKSSVWGRSRKRR